MMSIPFRLNMIIVRFYIHKGAHCKVKNSVRNNFSWNDKNLGLHHFPDLFIQGKSCVNTFYIQSLIKSAPKTLQRVELHRLYCTERDVKTPDQNTMFNFECVLKLK